MNILQAVGKDIKGAFAWLTSDKGQRTVQVVETGAEAITVAVAGTGAAALLDKGFSIVNLWGQEIIKSEVIAAAAGQQAGSGTQKAAAVLSSMEPQLASFLQGQNLTSDALTAKAKKINDALVLILNELGDSSTPAATLNAPALTGA